MAHFLLTRKNKDRKKDRQGRIERSSKRGTIILFTNERQLKRKKKGEKWVFDVRATIEKTMKEKDEKKYEEGKSNALKTAE